MIWNLINHQGLLIFLESAGDFIDINVDAPGIAARRMLARDIEAENK